jgi:hypothetical protein
MVRLQMEVIQELPQEVACGQCKSPWEVVIKDHRFRGLGRGHKLAPGGVTTHEICGREHPALVQ